MLRRTLQTIIWKYDRLFVTVIALIPASIQPLSSKLGKATLPSIWAAFLILLSATLFSIGQHQLALAGAAVIACIPVGTVLKLLVRRERPKTIYAQNMKIKSYSFPSSHTYAATIAGGYIILVALTIFTAPIGAIISLVYATLIVTIGVSRVHVGAHYPTDVTAGWVLGAGILYLITYFA